MAALFLNAEVSALNSVSEDAADTSTWTVTQTWKAGRMLLRDLFD